MPSDSYANFEKNLIDVDRLIESHNDLKTGKKGKHGLGHLTKSAIVMLCASWELYVEELSVEASSVLSKKVEDPLTLPISVQKELSNTVKNAKHDLGPLGLAGNGWKNIYAEYVDNISSNLNTPKSNKISELFEKSIGIEGLMDKLSTDKKNIDDFVTLRGDIAHRGRMAESDYLKVLDVVAYKDMIVKTAIEIDNIVSDFVRVNTDKKKPWKITKQNNKMATP